MEVKIDLRIITKNLGSDSKIGSLLKIDFRADWTHEFKPTARELTYLTNDGPVILTHLHKYQTLREITTSSHTEFHHQRSRPNVARDTGATKCGLPKDKFSVNSKKVLTNGIMCCL